jgi:hypothetical protein
MHILSENPLWINGELLGNIFWSIDGELLVRESYWCGSLEHD